MNSFHFDKLAYNISQIRRSRVWGRVQKVVGELVEASAPKVAKGALAEINGSTCEVIGFNQNIALLMPLDKISKIRQGDFVEYRANPS